MNLNQFIDIQKQVGTGTKSDEVPVKDNSADTSVALAIAKRASDAAKAAPAPVAIPTAGAMPVPN